MPVLSQLLDHVCVAVHDRVVISAQPVQRMEDQPAMRLEECLPRALLQGRVAGVQQVGELVR